MRCAHLGALGEVCPCSTPNPSTKHTKNLAGNLSQSNSARKQPNPVEENISGADNSPDGQLNQKLGLAALEPEFTEWFTPYEKHFGITNQII